MSKEAKVIVFNPNTGSATGITLEKVNGSMLDSIYEALDCNTVEFAKLNDSLGVYIDEEGNMIEDPVPGLIFVDRNSDIVGSLSGNIMFVNHDEDGNTIDLTNEQIEEILTLDTAEISNGKGRITNCIVIPVE